MSGLMLNLDMGGSQSHRASHDHSNPKHKSFLQKRKYLERKGFLKRKQLPHPGHQQQPTRQHNSLPGPQQSSRFWERSKNADNFEASGHSLAERNSAMGTNSFSSDGFSNLRQQKTFPKTNHPQLSDYHGRPKGNLTVTVDSNAHQSRLTYFASDDTKAGGRGSATPGVSHANPLAHRGESWTHAAPHKCNLMNEYESGLPSAGYFKKPHKLVAIDCEMVGTGPGARHSDLARCTVVGYYGDVMYDKYIQPPNPITDYRTRWSGIRKQHMKNATPFKAAQKEILKILTGKVVVGHAIHNDFKALNYFHPKSLTRDTSQIPLLNRKAGFNEKEAVSLKRLTKQLLKRDIQVGKNGHSSIEDAKATMELYRIVETEWEMELACNPARD